MTECKKLIKINEKARATPASKEMETAAMNCMRTKNGITANSLEEHERQKRRKTGTREETEDEARMLFDSDGEDGYQVDFGYKFVAAKNLWFTLFAAEEHRQLEEDGLSIGAFKKEDGQTKKIIRRYAIEIAYLFDEN